MKNPSRVYLQEMSVAERTELAAKAGTSAQYLYQIGAKLRNPSRRLAAKLEFVSNGRIRAFDFDNEAREAVSQ